MKSGTAMGVPKRYSVDQAAELLKRLYFTEREVMRTLAGYLAAVSRRELKLMIPKHFWEDSLRADALRTRVLELRYPRRDVDQQHDPRLQDFLSLLIRCENDAELIEGVYWVTKRALISSYETYLRETDALDDAPTVALMQYYPAQLRQQLNEVKPIYEQLPEMSSNNFAWRNEFESYLQVINGLLGAADGEVANEIPFISAQARSEFIPPVVPATDPRYPSALYHMPPFAYEESGRFIEGQANTAISHVNEIWAAEVPGMLMWKWNDMPWDFYTDLARWAYDEARHTQMGAERLEAWGFEIGNDIPLCSEMHASQVGHGELGLLALLHAFECMAPAGKSALKRQFEEEGDTSSSQDFDYDWADESIHMFYGHKWMLHRLNGDLDLMETMKEEALERYMQTLNERRQQWDYEPFLSRIVKKLDEIEEKRHE